MEKALAVLYVVPMLFLIVLTWHYKHLRYLLLIWTNEYLTYGEIITKEKSVSYFESMNSFTLVFRFLKTDKKYPELRNSELLMNKLKEYRLTRNVLLIGMTLYSVGFIIVNTIRT